MYTIIIDHKVIQLKEKNTFCMFFVNEQKYYKAISRYSSIAKTKEKIMKPQTISANGTAE